MIITIRPSTTGSSGGWIAHSSRIVCYLNPLKILVLKIPLGVIYRLKMWWTQEVMLKFTWLTGWTNFLTLQCGTDSFKYCFRSRVSAPYIFSYLHIVLDEGIRIMPVYFVCACSYNRPIFFTGNLNNAAPGRQQCSAAAWGDKGVICLDPLADYWQERCWILLVEVEPFFPHAGHGPYGGWAKK